MISLQKWARLTGHRNPDLQTELPDDVLVVGSDVSRMFPPTTLVPGSTAYDAEFTIDPGAGGIVASSLMLEAPVQGADVGVLTVSVARTSAASFLPGIYSIRAELRNAFAPAVRKGLQFDVVAQQGIFPWAGGSTAGIWRSALYLDGGSPAFQVRSFSHRLYIPQAWELLVNIGTAAFVDADVWTVHLAVDNEYILDEPGSMSY